MMYYSKTTRNILAVILFLGLGIVMLFLYLQSSNDPSATGGNSPNKSIIGDARAIAESVKAKASRMEALKELGELNEQSITFYGRLIDQDGNPVADAKIGGATLFNNMVSHGIRKYWSSSDANGYFTFENIKGRDFNCTPLKDGYLYQPAKGYNGYILSKLAPANERFVPDPKNPEIFRLWKIKAPEPLIAGGLAFYIPSDGTVVYVDLKTGIKTTEKGDIAFWCEYQALPKNALHKERAVEWKFGIRIIGGGVIPTDSQLPYEAPQDGYQEEWTFKIAKDSGGPTLEEQTFYFKTASHNYGALNLDAQYDPTSPKCSTRIGWKINPSGSRNLEPGKEQTTTGMPHRQPGKKLQQLRLDRG